MGISAPRLSIADKLKASEAYVYNEAVLHCQAQASPKPHFG